MTSFDNSPPHYSQANNTITVLGMLGIHLSSRASVSSILDLEGGGPLGCHSED